MNEAARLESVRRYLDRCEEQPETWKVDHDAAMRCFAIQEASAFLVFVHGRISLLDENIRLSILSKKAPYNAELEENVFGLYRQWQEAAKKLLEGVEFCENEGYEVEGAIDLRQCLQETCGILTPDAEFFSDLSKLRDAAIELHRNGLTEDLGV